MGHLLADCGLVSLLLSAGASLYAVVGAGADDESSDEDEDTTAIATKAAREGVREAAKAQRALELDGASSSDDEAADERARHAPRTLLLFALDAAQRALALADNVRAAALTDTPLEFVMSAALGDRDLGVSEPACVLLLQLCTRVAANESASAGSGPTSSSTSAGGALMQRLTRASLVPRAATALQRWAKTESRLRAAPHSGAFFLAKALGFRLGALFLSSLALSFAIASHVCVIVFRCGRRVVERFTRLASASSSACSALAFVGH